MIKIIYGLFAYIILYMRQLPILWLNVNLWWSNDSRITNFRYIYSDTTKRNWSTINDCMNLWIGIDYKVYHWDEYIYINNRYSLIADTIGSGVVM